MPIWSSVDPVATVAQIAGVDAYGLISMVTERAEKVRRNKYECRQLAEHVETVGGLLHHVERDDPRIAAPLEKLEGTLREAVVLVSSCEASSYFRRFFRGAKIAEQFQRIKEKIDFYLQLFPVITCIYTTSVFSRRLDSAPHTQVRRYDRSIYHYPQFTIPYSLSLSLSLIIFSHMFTI